MAKEVFLSRLAERNYEAIVDYIMAEWGVKSANYFIDRLIEVRILMSENPALYSFHDELKQIRRCVVTKHNVLYFKEKKDSIIILTIFHTLQNPEKLRSIF